MKNLFLTLAFVLVTAFSFANTNLSNSTQEKVEQVDGAMELTLSCGVSGTLSWTGSPSFSDVMEEVDRLEDLYC